MRPVKLEFCGLNSFSERAVIDFAPLLQSGIFGIFGETGSGKSTILDAINFALYGDIERNPDKTDKINYNCDELDVKFTFDIISCGKRKTYLAERTIKRKSGTHKAILYEFSDGNSVAIADNVKTVNDKITEIIGINKEDFRKCIALPQGEFAQFVDSAPGERIELIERLFNLQKYGKGLKSRLSARESDAQTQYDTLCGSLSVYENDTKEALTTLEERKKALEIQAEENRKNSAVCAEKFAKLADLYEKQKAYKEAEAKLKELEEKKPAFDELGKVLPILSYCENAVQNAAEADGYSKKIAATSEKLAETKAEGEKLAAELSAAEEQLKNGNFDAEIERLQRAESAMQSLAPTVKNYMDKRAERDALRDKFRKERAALAVKQQEVAATDKKYTQAKAALDAMPAPDIDEYFKKEFKGSILRDEYARTLNYIKDLQAELRTFKDNSPLYEFIQSELDRKGDEYKQLILSYKDAKLDVNEKLAEFQQKLKDHRTAENNVTRIQGEKKAAELDLANTTARLADIQQQGEKASRESDESEKILKEVFGEDIAKFSEKLAKAAADTRAARAKKEEISKRAEQAKKAVSDNAAQMAAENANLAAANDMLSKARSSLEGNLARAGFDKVEECKALILKYKGYKQAHAEYTDFTAQYAAAKSRAESFKPAAGTQDVPYEQVERAEAEKKEAEKLFTQISGELAVAVKSAEDLKARLKEKAELEKKFAAVKHERDLIGKLKSLIRDNRFMEYIANEHLENISRAASRTLIELTDGRYFLSYTDNNFCVGDNYNGGNLRKVKTLSGGETFLVSLSLALALSATICRRSLKSIEFFFLDEGFGTLDADLIDTVLGALEKLKNENFAIGLISHVEELKHRITSKILVSKATESHGSRITVSC